MTRRWAVALIGAALAGGCAGEKSPPPNLPFACFCPTGYVLRLADG